MTVAWGISGYSYRKSVTVSRASGAVTNYSMMVNVHTKAGTDSGLDVYIPSGLRSDFNDIRFTTADGTTLLDYWIESITPETTDICNGGTPTASNQNLPNEGIAKAFDNNFTTTKWYSWGNTAWVEYQLPATQIATGYTITAGNDYVTRDPKDWTFGGSNDNTNWTTLHTVTGHTSPSRLAKETWSFSNSTPYLYYRWNITASIGGADLQVEEFEILIGTIATIWVEFDSIGTGATTFYMYYNDADAAAQYATPLLAGEATFIFFDDFSAGNLDKWSGSKTYFSISGGILTMAGNSANADVSIAANTYAGSTSSALRTRHYVYSTGTSRSWTGLQGAHAAWLYQDGGAKLATTNGGWGTATSNWTLGSYQIRDIIARGGTNDRFLQNGADVTGSPRTTYASNCDMTIVLGLHAGSSNIYSLTDWILLRQYIYAEPVFGSWGSQELGAIYEGQTYRLVKIVSDFSGQTKRRVDIGASFSGQTTRAVKSAAVFVGQTIREVSAEATAYYNAQLLRIVTKASGYTAQAVRMIQAAAGYNAQARRASAALAAFIGQTRRILASPPVKIVENIITGLGITASEIATRITSRLPGLPTISRNPNNAGTQDKRKGPSIDRR